MVTTTQERMHSGIGYYDPTPTSETTTMDVMRFGIGYYDPTPTGKSYSEEKQPATIYVIIIFPVWLGKGYTWDGSTWETFYGHPRSACFVAVASDGSKAYMVGGLLEDGSIISDVYVSGEQANSYVEDKGKMYEAIIYGGESEVYVYDGDGKPMKIIPAGIRDTAVLDEYGRIVSLKTFKMKIFPAGRRKA